MSLKDDQNKIRASEAKKQELVVDNLLWEVTNL
jgi:hypothetical protein